jgi:hypothetical protein
LTAVALTLAACTSATAKPTGVVTGVVYACEAVHVRAGEIFHVKVSLYSGSKRVDSETVRSAIKFRFSVTPGEYRVTGWWGSKEVNVHPDEVVSVTGELGDVCL